MQNNNHVTGSNTDFSLVATMIWAVIFLVILLATMYLVNRVWDVAIMLQTVTSVLGR